MIPEKAIYQFLDTNGDGGGTTNANGDYSTPDEFFFLSKGDAFIERMIIHIEDTTGATAEKYGNIAELTNGYEIKVMNDAVVLADLTAGIPIKSNAGLGRFCYDVVQPTIGAGNDFVQARWTFSRAGEPLYIAPGNKLSITFSDDLQGLIEHTFMLQGYYR